MKIFLLTLGLFSLLTALYSQKVQENLPIVCRAAVYPDQRGVAR